MKSLLCILYFIPIVSYCQNLRNGPSVLVKGIQFFEGQNWEEVLKKANEENKYIFVDCFASWCIPCKQMEKIVYSDENVNTFIRDKFLCVKIQMDTSNEDNKTVKEWYMDARKIMQENEISSFPTFLFFSPSGKLLHKGVGFRNVKDFLTLVDDALNASKQYYTLLHHYRNGQREYESMRYLSLTALKLGDTTVALIVAKDYITNYLMNGDVDRMYQKDNISFIASNVSIIHVKDKVFKMFYKDGNVIDSIMDRPGYSRAVVDIVITNAYINPKLHNVEGTVVENPNWRGIYTKIRKLYNKKIAERNVINAKIRRYKEDQNWEELAKYNLLKIRKFGLDTSGLGKYLLNNMFWDVFFRHVNDKKLLKKGIKWMELIAKETNEPTEIDTYANLLYKYGRVEDAKYYERKAMKLEEERAIKLGEVPDQIFQETLNKMLNGEVTWDPR